jgi:MFS family permease
MSTQRFHHHRSRHWLAAWTADARLGRLATVLAAAVAGLLASAAAATAAFANPIPVGDGGAVPIAPVRAATVQVISTGGMAGWQIALIAAGAALAAATAAVFADRKLAGRRSITATTARCAHPQPHTKPA